MSMFSLSLVAFGTLAMVFSLPGLTSTPVRQLHIVVRVTDASDGSPLSGVRVPLAGGRALTVTVTDALGEYDLAIGVPGLLGTPATFRVSSIGYASALRTVMFSDTVIGGDFALSPSRVPQEEVVVIVCNGRAGHRHPNEGPIADLKAVSVLGRHHGGRAFREWTLTPEVPTCGGGDGESGARRCG